jgi:ATP-binding cassette subfamily B protein
MALPLRADPRRSVAVFVLTAASSLIGALSAFWLKQVIDQAGAGDQAAATRSAAAIGLTVGAGMLCRSSAGMLFPLKENTGLHLDRSIMGLVGQIPTVEHHERPDHVARIGVLRQEAWILTFAGTNAAGALALVVQAIATGVLLASVTPLLLLVPLFAAAPTVAGAKAERIRQAALDEVAEDARQARHLFDLATTPAAGKELRIFGVGPQLLARHRAAWDATDRCLDAAARRGLVRTAGSWLVFAVGYAGAVAVVVGQAVAGRASVGEVVLALALVAQVNLQVGAAVHTVSSAVRTVEVAGRYVWLADHARASRPVVTDPAPVPERLVHGIELSGVSFRYPGTDRDVLAGFDLTLPAGATVAVVGDNGAGKSTLVKLLCRFYEPSEGVIEADGVDVRRMDVNRWRERMSAGFQDFVRFELPAGRTVGVGDLPLVDDAAAITSALERAASPDIVADLPDGLATQLGTSFDAGVELSGGQWQKLALARAMMRPAPLLLVLDEPTAALDAETEHLLFARYAVAASALAARTGGVTVIVSHRFSTVRMADLIVVVDGGRIVERGSHDQLMAAGGLYPELYDLQARAYR